MIGDLDLYQQMRARGEPSPLLRIAETWLRAELDDMHSRGEEEAPLGVAAQAAADPTQVCFVSGGGYSSGRMAAYDFVGAK